MQTAELCIARSDCSGTPLNSPAETLLYHNSRHHTFIGKYLSLWEVALEDHHPTGVK